jgi:hypothetical protein
MSAKIGQPLIGEGGLASGALEQESREVAVEQLNNG